MIKKIQIELFVFTLIVISTLFTYNIDLEIIKFFSKLNFGMGAPYLKDFFVNITELGDSLWYFLIIFFIFIISFVLKNTKLLSTKRYFYIKNLSLFSFLYLLLTGIIVQAIKHVVGRTRPNHKIFDDSYGFNFFSTDSAFHSFPSGHSSTIIAITLILCLILPSLRVFFYLSGSVIAISRVVVGAHYLTDVVAGGIISIVVYKIFYDFYNKNIYKFSLDSFGSQETSAVFKISVVFIIVAIFLTVGPEFDIFFSSLFYYSDNQFMIQSYYLVSIIFRKFLLPLLLIYVFIFPIISKFFSIKKIFFNYSFSFKEIFFIWLSGLITLIMFVNLLLKNMWGRSRPNDIVNFEGKNIFTPWYKIGDSCFSNCSFVSGDASVGFFLLVFYFIIKKNIFCYLALFFGILLGFIRIIAGGHFFSDVVFSQITVIISLSLLSFFYTKLYAK